jgi:hypothetical protein
VTFLIAGERGEGLGGGEEAENRERGYVERIELVVGSVLVLI